MARWRPFIPLLLLLAAVPAAAQQGPVSCSSNRAPADTARADVVITASARIDELRFQSSPQARLTLLGCDSVRVTERRNLPRPVQPGVTYRDVGLGIEIRSWLNVQCLLPGLARAGQAAASESARALASLCSPAPADSARRAPAPASGP